MVQDLSPRPRSVWLTGRRGLQYVISVLLTVLFLWIAFRGTDGPRLLASLREANYWWIGLSFVCLLASHLVRAFRWRFLLDPIKPKIGLRNLFSGVMIGYLFNNVLPRAGEFVRPYVIGRLERISKSSALGTIVVERIIDTFTFLFLVVLLPLVYDGPLLDSFPWLQRAGIVVTMVTGGGLAILVVFMVRRDWTDVVMRGMGRWLPTPFEMRLQRTVHEFLDGFLFMKNPAHFVVIILTSMVVWFLYILMVYVAFFAFGLGSLGLGAAVVVQTVSSIGVAMPTPGGTGSYHVFTSQALMKLFGVDPVVALSYATVTHAAGYIGVTIIGLYYFLHDQIGSAGMFAQKEGDDA